MKIARIYLLSCMTTGKNYIGTTTAPLNVRLSKHKTNAKMYLEGKRKNYTSSFEIINNNNYTIKLLEECPFENRYELETDYINRFDCVNLYKKNV